MRGVATYNIALIERGLALDAIWNLPATYARNIPHLIERGQVCSRVAGGGRGFRTLGPPSSGSSKSVGDDRICRRVGFPALGKIVSVAWLHVRLVERPRWLPVPRQQLIEPARRMALNHSFEHISEIGKGLDVVELGRGEKRSDNGPAIAAAVRAGEQIVLAAERNRPVILPMSSRRSRSIIAGTHSMGAAFGSA
jgi:hypothetical protein